MFSAVQFSEVEDVMLDELVMIVAVQREHELQKSKLFEQYWVSMMTATFRKIQMMAP